MGGGGREEFIREHHGDIADCGLEIRGESAHTGAGTAFAAVQSQRQPQHESPRPSFSHQLGDTGHRLHSAHIDTLYRESEDTFGVRGGDTDASRTEVDT